MNNEIMFRAIGQVGDDLIVRAGKEAAASRMIWLKWTALAACCLLVIGLGAFAGLFVFGGANSAAPESAEGEQVMEESAVFEDTVADAAPAERPVEETTDAEAPVTQGCSDPKLCFRYDGRVYCKAPDNDPNQAAAESEDVPHGEKLGTIAEGSLAGCEIFLLPDASAQEYLLVLLDGEYVLFKAAE